MELQTTFYVKEMEPVQNFDFDHWILRLIALVIDSLIISVVAWILWSFVFVFDLKCI